MQNHCSSSFKKLPLWSDNLKSHENIVKETFSYFSNFNMIFFYDVTRGLSPVVAINLLFIIIMMIFTCVNPVIWTGCWMLQLTLNIKSFLSFFILFLLNSFWGTFKIRKRLRDFILKLVIHSLFSFDIAKNKNVNKYSKFDDWFQHSTNFWNDIMHT